jgi:hypothetical protein
MRFELDQKAVKEIRNSPQMRDFLLDVAKDAKDNLEVNHRPMKGRREPKYRAFIERGPDGYRAVVEAKGSFWHWPEYGTSRGRPATAPLRRAAGYAMRKRGGEFTPTPKPQP